jgi:hypothetical protein
MPRRPWNGIGELKLTEASGSHTLCRNVFDGGARAYREAISRAFGTSQQFCVAPVPDALIGR